jgi:hypothetical protein
MWDSITVRYHFVVSQGDRSLAMEGLMRGLRVIWGELRTGQYIETYFTILLGIVISILGMVSAVDLQVLIAATTALLALLAWGHLTSRRATEGLSVAIDEIRSLAVSHMLARDPNPSATIRGLIDSAQSDIWILTRIGMTLQDQRVAVEQAMNRGCHVKAIVCSEDEATLTLLAKRGRSLNTPDMIRMQMEVARQTVCRMIDQSGASRDRFEFYELAFIPAQSIYVVDPMTAQGRAFVQLTTFRSTSYHGLTISIHKSEQPDMFHFFQEQFEKYLEASTPIVCEG